MTTAAPSVTLPDPTRDELRALLLSGQFQAVQRVFDGRHAAHDAGHLGEHDLLRTYRVARSYREELTPALRAWVAAGPESAPAQVALGQHLLGQGLKLRTRRLGRDIPEANRDAMAGAWGAAAHQFTHALTLDPAATLAHTGLITLQTLQGDRAWDEYARGLAQAPTSLALRVTMLRNLRTEWGGSDHDQDAFLRRPEHDQLSPDDRAHLAAVRTAQHAHHLAHFKHDPRGARAAYRRSLAQWPTVDALTGLSDVSPLFQRRALTARAVALDPSDDSARAHHAIARLETWARAAPQLAILADCAAWGEPYAADTLDLPGWLWRWRPLLMVLVRRLQG
ncbi:DUF4034 domain-containing protein [uncultured Deinococcus sp.]|uniref:DUF4034 domain-containing protein n=1 Tax=uncultured Deinococcus sp. TaxID=158789 RepID=UPI0025D33C29|nr:DUF4034 domain-containing protein [uncultured Deinococcus sp.]